MLPFPIDYYRYACRTQDPKLLIDPLEGWLVVTATCARPLGRARCHELTLLSARVACRQACAVAHHRVRKCLAACLMAWPTAPFLMPSEAHAPPGLRQSALQDSNLSAMPQVIDYSCQTRRRKGSSGGLERCFATRNGHVNGASVAPGDCYRPGAAANSRHGHRCEAAGGTGGGTHCFGSCTLGSPH